MNALFDVDANGHIVVKDRRIMLVPEFRDVLDLPKGEKWFTYVFCVADYLSPYAHVVKEADREKQVYADVIGPGAMKIPDQVAPAIKKYYQLQFNNDQRILRVLNGKLAEATDSLEMLGANDQKGMMEIITMSSKLTEQHKKVKEHEANITKLSMANHVSKIYEGLSIIEVKLRQKQEE